VKENKVDEYMKFFRTNYTQRKRTSSTQSSGDSQPTTQQTNATTNNSTATANTNVSDGPYDTSIAGKHKVVFVIPAQGINKQAFISGIENYNRSNFANSGFVVEEQGLDAARHLVVVTGLNDEETARAYFDNVKRTRSLFAPIGNAQYRNFLISDANFNIFLQEKNIIEYMDFYKKVYLGQ
jgi:hypothetical protein